MKLKKIWKCLGMASIIPTTITTACCLSACASKEEKSLDSIKIVSDVSDIEVALGQSLKSTSIIAKGYDKEGNELSGLSLKILLSDETGNKLPNWITINGNNQICISSSNTAGTWTIHVQAVDTKSSIKSDYRSLKITVIDPISIPDSLEIDCPDYTYVLAPKTDHFPIGLVAYKDGEISYDCDKTCQWEITNISPIGQPTIQPTFELEDLGTSSTLHIGVSMAESIEGDFEVTVQATSMKNPEIVVTKTILIQVVNGFEYIDPANDYHYERSLEDGKPWRLTKVPEGTVEIANVKTEIYGLPVTEVTSNFWPSGPTIEDTLVSVNLPKSITKIGAYAFCQQKNLALINMPGVKQIGEGAFRECTLLRFSLTSEQPRLEKVGDFAFDSCKSIAFDIAQPLTEIGDFAFNNSGIQQMTLDGDIKTMGTQAFGKCYSLRTLIFYDWTPAVCEGEFVTSYSQEFKIYVPEEAKADYLSADIWCNHSSYIYGF